MFNTDSIYVIGYNHKVCEDYAYSGIIPNTNTDIPYAIICDGCSSTQDSDVGARLLAHGFKNFLRKMGNNIHYYHNEPNELYDDLCYHLKRTIHNSAESVGLYPSSFVATIRAMAVIKDKLFCFHFGDGYTIHQQKNESALKEIKRSYIASTMFPSGIPYYFMNHINKRERENYSDVTDNYDILYNDVVINSSDYYINSDTHFYSVIDLNELPDGNHVFTVTSDGIDTFYIFDDCGKQIEIPVETIMDKAFAFKNFHGEFVKRRFNKFFKYIKNENIKHYDDFSVASIYFDKTS